MYTIFGLNNPPKNALESYPYINNKINNYFPVIENHKYFSIKI